VRTYIYASMYVYAGMTDTENSTTMTKTMSSFIKELQDRQTDSHNSNCDMMTLVTVYSMVLTQLS
jgi:hypothetical protein